ncbi:hypothetical protein [Microvirga calopogonii]|uniref:hypothetical protein n=1 Tax=Microvirga calopogonii TaxID=2078013 RepID=UPI0013B3A029|nr:hypothetical protein [Microvirga calopogonii]
MKIFPKPASFSRIALLCAVLGVSVATQAQAFFPDDEERPPPNGLNGSSLNGLTLNGLTLTGLTVNGRDAKGHTLQILAPHAVALPNGERVELR